MRKINYIVVHCSATREGCTLTSEALEAEHRRRGFRTTGYHYARVCGHRDLSPDLDGDGKVEPWEWVKQCPCFEVSKEF